MDINLTFCVQIINFLIFYYGVSYFFLKPFVEFIQARNSTRQHILGDFADKEEQLKLLRKSSKELVQEFKLMLKNRYPVSSVKIFDIPDNYEPVKKVSTNDGEIIAQELATNLVIRIKNAY